MEKMRHCPNGHEVSDNDKFCPLCGVLISRTCPNGHEVSGEDKFCPQCGAQIDNSGGGALNVQKQKSSNKWSLFLAVALFIIAFCGAAWYFSNNHKDSYSLKGLAKVEKYDEVVPFNDGLARVCKNGKWGFIDRHGKEVIPCNYDSAYSFSEKRACVYKEGKWGFINKKGKVVIPCIFDGARSFSEGYASILKDGKYGFVNKRGKIVIPCQYDDAVKFSEGLACIAQYGKYGFINKKGKVVVPCKYESASSFTEGLAKVKSGSWGFVNKKGEVVIPCKYDNALEFSEGLACVEKDGKSGYINKEGKIVIPCKFFVAISFKDGLAPVIIDSKVKEFGYINKIGDLVINGKSLDIYNFGLFFDGLAVVKRDDKDGEISTQSKGGRTWISYEKKGKSGYINKTGEFVIPCEYDYASDFSEGLAVVKRYGVWGFVDKTGKSTFEEPEIKLMVENKKKEIERKKEEERLAEERRREEERRRGVDKEVRLSITLGSEYPYKKDGNYGAHCRSGIYGYVHGVYTDLITIPSGKAWIYKGYNVTSGIVSGLSLIYFSRENEYSDYGTVYPLHKGGLPILRPGDEFKIKFVPMDHNGTSSVAVSFVEKDEDLVY